MRPIQRWLPMLADTLSDPRYQRDARRAMESWKGEYRVWLLPDIKKEARWQEPLGDGKIRVPVVAVPSEHLDRLDVYHIGATGEVWGIERGRFPDGRVDGLLQAWLNLFALNDKVTYYCAPETITLRVPRIRRRGVEYINLTLCLIPGPTIRFSRFNAGSRTVWGKWPPKRGWPAPVSPDAESSQYYGAFRRDDVGQLSIATSPL
jgi:hypothetical protein